jgi:hypothetical protein
MKIRNLKPVAFTFTVPPGLAKIIEQLARVNSCSKAQIVRMIFLKGMQKIDIKSLNFFTVKHEQGQASKV